MARRRAKAKDPAVLPTIWSVPDELWATIEQLLAKYDPPARTGRPRVDQRRALDVAGNPVTRLNSITGQASSEIVIFLDTKSLYHADSTKDVYELEPGEENEYFANYAYLDGHAEGHKYETLDAYIGQLHTPIDQKWFGTDFRTLAPESYEEPYP